MNIIVNLIWYLPYHFSCSWIKNFYWWLQLANFILLFFCSSDIFKNDFFFKIVITSCCVAYLSRYYSYLRIGTSFFIINYDLKNAKRWYSSVLFFVQVICSYSMQSRLIEIKWKHENFVEWNTKFFLLHVKKNYEKVCPLKNASKIGKL